MKKEKILGFRTVGLAALLFGLGTVSAQAQSVGLSVKQDSIAVGKLGTAVHSLAGDSLTIEVVDGKVVVTNGNGKVASLPCANGGELVVESSDAEQSGSLSATVDSSGYGTLYSPFQLTVPDSSDVEVYAPELVDGRLMLTDATRLAAGTVVNPETGLVLKNAGTVSFSLSGSAPSSVESALTGSSLTIETPSLDDYTLCTLGQAQGEYGFYAFLGDTVPAGEAYLLLDNAESDETYVLFDDGHSGETGIEDATSVSSSADGKRVEDGRLVIVKGNRKYTVDGVRIK